MAICLPKHESKYVSALKYQLKCIIGWYHSCNSVAHVTIATFKTSKKILKKIVVNIDRRIQDISVITLTFSTLSSYEVNGTFFIAPDDNSSKLIKDVMRNFHGAVICKTSNKVYNPHMTIARKLSKEKLIIAKKSISSGWLNFNCDRLILRKHNKATGQFEPIAEFKFLGDKNLEDQLSLSF